MKYLLILVLLLPGCTLTQVGALKELSAQRSARYDAYVEAQAVMISDLTKLIADADRGGVEIKLTTDGRVKSFKTTERLDIRELMAIAALQRYPEEPVASTLEELGNFVGKATNLGVVIAREHYNHLNTEEIQRANVLINGQNKSADTAMWNAYTGNYANDSASVTTSDVEHVSDISNTEHISDTTNVERISDTTNTEHTSNTTDTSSDVRDVSSEIINGSNVNQ